MNLLDNFGVYLIDTTDMVWLLFWTPPSANNDNLMGLRANNPDMDLPGISYFLLIE